jgi:GNAT superfamily N-acetyltransferase
VSEVSIRRASAADVQALARHRSKMFLEMGRIKEASYDALFEASREYFEAAIPDGSYIGFVGEKDGEVVAGGGVFPRLTLPRPTPDGKVLATSRQGLVMNVYTELAHRKQGFAERIMREIFVWAEAESVPFLVLHASDAGRPIYERLGFRETNELGLFVGVFHFEQSRNTNDYSISGKE